MTEDYDFLGEIRERGAELGPQLTKLTPNEAPELLRALERNVCWLAAHISVLAVRAELETSEREHEPHLQERLRVVLDDATLAVEMWGRDEVDPIDVAVKLREIEIFNSHIEALAIAEGDDPYAGGGTER